MKNTKMLETLKNLSVKSSDLEIFSQYFSIIHHSKGRIRLRASLKLKQVAKDKEIDPKALLETLEKIPFISSIKFNPLIGSLTILYDANRLEPKLWEDCIKGESLEKITEIINQALKEVV